MPRRRVKRPRLEHVLGYVGPIPNTAAFKRKPFSGKKVTQEVSPGVFFEGHLLMSQCQATTARLDRCRRNTGWDYQYCNYHLLRDFHLMVAPSRLPGAGLGVYAVNEAQLRLYGKDKAGRPKATTHVVFNTGDTIGNGFGGELMDDEGYTKRYGDYGSLYALVHTIETHRPFTTSECTIDGFLARTVSSYCNDSVNVEKSPNWPYHHNAEWDDYDGLAAAVPIEHGEEVLWDYGAGYWGGREVEEEEDEEESDDETRYAAWLKTSLRDARPQCSGCFT